LVYIVKVFLKFSPVFCGLPVPSSVEECSVFWRKMDLDNLKKQCRITTFRARGPGGQHRNVTDSAVRLQHLPTGIVVIGRRHRSQHQNIKDALARLALKIEENQRVPRTRLPTRKPRAVRVRELEAKKKHGELKRLRRRVRDS